jgi:hypothetical protein
MAGNLEKKLSVPAFVHQYAFGRPLNRQPARNERSRGEAKTLVHVFTLEPHELNGFGLPKFLLGDQQLWAAAFEKVSCLLESDNLLI